MIFIRGLRFTRTRRRRVPERAAPTTGWSIMADVGGERRRRRSRRMKEEIGVGRATIGRNTANYETPSAFDVTPSRARPAPVGAHRASKRTWKSSVKGKTSHKRAFESTRRLALGLRNLILLLMDLAVSIVRLTNAAITASTPTTMRRRIIVVIGIVIIIIVELGARPVAVASIVATVVVEICEEPPDVSSRQNRASNQKPSSQARLE